MKAKTKSRATKAATEKTDDRFVLSPTVRLAFNKFWKPREFKNEKTGVIERVCYDGTFIIIDGISGLKKDSNEMSAYRDMKRKIAQAFTQKFPDEDVEDFKIGNEAFHYPIRTHKSYKKCATAHPYYMNNLMFAAKSYDRPISMYADIDGHRTELIRGKKEHEDLIYSGCLVRVLVGAFPFDQKGGTGVALSAQAILKVGDMEPLGNFVDAEAAFSAVPIATADNEDEFDDDDDEYDDDDDDAEV